ncbi:MAG TPA: HAMP domain-containing sensor histidine kinase, partial [Phycisphaerae bacterium]|nr:HAMP domain-containing sensor histidine kinase [Phycisphaerae bacterium]
DEESGQWTDAEKLEYEAARPDEAAEAYAKIAQDANGINVKARALRAEARCLVKAGSKRQAIEILTGPLAGDDLRDAKDDRGRLITPGAMLLAVELLGDPDSAESRSLAAKLAERVNDYAAAMSSPQRRFLMRSLRAAAPGAADYPTLAAEDLAADYLDAAGGPAAPLRLSRAAAPGLWHIASADGKTVAIFREERLLADLRAAGKLDEPFAEAGFSLVPPTPATQRDEPFLTAPAAEQMPGWQIAVRLVGEDSFAAAAGRQNAAYLWTGMLGIGIIAVLGLTVARYLSRQMKLTSLKNDLIATVSHELKTPLASMRVLVDTLLAGRCEQPDRQREYFQLIAGENERLSRLIDNFLTFSRMERNKRAFEFTDLSVEEVVAAAVESVRERFDSPGCRFEVDVAADLPPIVGDRDALITVLLNLLDNAWKYSPGDKRISLRASASAEGVCLAVADSGIGLSRRAARKVFGRFYQVDRSLARGAGGCGLGLAIVKFIVDAHGGTIDVESRSGQGSRFIVRLPAASTKRLPGSV